MVGARVWTSSQELLPRYIEQDRGHQASSQSGLGVGLQAFPSSKEFRRLGLRAHVRVPVFLSCSLLRGFPQSCLPHAARRVAAHRKATQGLGKWALCCWSSLPVQFTVPNTFTPCDSGPFSQAPMSLLDPRRFGELVLTHCSLSWAGQRAPIYPLYTAMPLAKLPRRSRTSCFIPGELWGSEET